MWKKIKEFNDWYIENKNVFEGVFKILVIGFVLLCFAIALKKYFQASSQACNAYDTAAGRNTGRS